MSPKSFSLIFTLALALCANAHSLILSVDGANGVTGTGFGVVQTTPRDGDDQSDTTRIRGRRSGVCGETENGENDVALNMAAAAASGIPSADQDGAITMTIHQVNGDGAGPFTCEVSADGTGTAFQTMQVVTQVPGRNGRSRAEAENFPLVAQMPAGTTCTGGPDGNACLMRCIQPRGFGGCTAITNGGNNAASGNNATDTVNNNNTGDNSENTNASDSNAGGNSNINNGSGDNDNTATGAEEGNANNANGDNATTDETAAATGNNTGSGNGNGGNGGGSTTNTRQGLLETIASRVLGRRSPAAAASPEADPKLVLHNTIGRVARSRIARGARVDWAA